MKLTFFTSSKLMLRAFQLVLLATTVFGLGVLIFVENNTYNLSLGTLGLIENIELDQSSQVKISSNGDHIAPELKVDKVQLKYSSVSKRTGWVIGLFLICLSAVGIYALEQLRKMIQSVEKGDPFVRDNVWRIYILAALIYCVPLLNWIYYYSTKLWIEHNFELTGLKMEYAYGEVGKWILFGTLLMIIGKIFEQGINMKEEQELTI
ncbi:MAG: DUF2975 domain-containing protein [Marinoscillum sp.]